MSWKCLFQRIIGRKGEPDLGNEKGKNQLRATEEAEESRVKAADREGRGKNELSIQSTAGTNVRRRQVVIGLDFGTAYTKVVLRTDEKRYAVAFDVFSVQENDYLLPSQVYEAGGGEFRLGARPGDSVVGEIKMRLLRGDYSLDALGPMVAYVALVLRHARGWFLSTYRELYGSDVIDWYVNVGLPTESHEIDQLHTAYREVLESAWVVSINERPITRVGVNEVLQKIQEGVDEREIVNSDLVGSLIHKDNIALFPEFVAQVAGYVRSTRRQNGTHGLIDVGAGTVDATVFRVVTNAEGDDIHPILSKSTEPLGVEFLLQHRLRKIGVEQSLPTDHRDILLRGNAEEAARVLKVSTGELNKIDTSFRQKAIKQVADILHEAKELQLALQVEGVHRYADAVWEGAVPTFHCGGGAKHQFYREVVEYFESLPPPGRVVRRQLPQPEELSVTGLQREEFDRLSVAYGLSFDADDLGEITRPESTTTRTAQPTRTCPICGGTGGGYHDCARCGGSGFL